MRFPASLQLYGAQGYSSLEPKRSFSTLSALRERCATQRFHGAFQNAQSLGFGGDGLLENRDDHRDALGCARARSRKLTVVFSSAEISDRYLS